MTEFTSENACEFVNEVLRMGAERGFTDFVIAANHRDAQGHDHWCVRCWGSCLTVRGLVSEAREGADALLTTHVAAQSLSTTKERGLFAELRRWIKGTPP
jgi:hypothetical protein